MKQKIIQLPKEWNKILIVGEAPGTEEAASVRYNDELKGYYGTPFIGTEGQYLRHSCKVVGFPFENCIVTNTVHEQPQRNNYENLTKEVIEEGKQELINDIKNYNPTFIIALGARALLALTGKPEILKYRGSVLPCSIVPGYKVFTSVHPGYIFRGNQQFDIVLKMDMRKALEENFREIRYPERNVKVIYDLSDALKALYDLQFWQTPVVVDIETAGGQLIAYGVATSKSEAIVIPKDLLKEVEILRAISEFADSSVPKIFHNCLYDVFHNAYYYKIYNRNIHFDTMLAQHAIFPTLPKSLAFCSSIYTKEPYWKDEGKEVTKDYSPNKIVDWNKFYIYNGKDCCVTYEVYEKQQEELDLWKSRDILDLMMRAVDPSLYSMMCGFNIDWDNQKDFKEKNEKSIEVLEKIKLKTIGDVNFRSSQQVCNLLYDVWKLPVRKNQGNRTADDHALDDLSTLPTNVQHFLGLIQRTREHLKLRDFYEVEINEDGRLRYSIKLHGTYTGRWATSKSITGSGMNMQNQPKIARVLYKADPNKIFLQWDLSNSEARIVAALCQDEQWLKSFDIEDQHSVVTMALFNIPKERVKDKYSGDKTYRDYGKKVAHATHYLEQAGKLSITIGCSRNEAQRHIEAYKRLRPKLADWHRYVATEVKKTRVIRTYFNRVIQFFGPHFEQRLPEAIACEPQSTSADYMTTGLVECLEKIPELEFRLQVHDSGLIQINDDLSLIKTIIPKIKAIMERSIVIRGLEFKIPIEFDLGYNWGKMKEIKNLDNIDEIYRSLKG